MSNNKEREDKHDESSSSYDVNMEGVVGAGKTFTAKLMVPPNKGYPDKFKPGLNAAGDTTSVQSVVIKGEDVLPLTEKKNQTISLNDQGGKFDNDVKRHDALHKQADNLYTKGKACVLHVISPNGSGRITPENAETRRVLSNCYGVQKHSIVGVINRVPKFPTLQAQTDYEKSVVDYVKNQNLEYNEIVFIPELNEDDVKEYQHYRELLWKAVSKCVAEQHRIIKERETAASLLLEEEKKKKEKEAADKKQAEDEIKRKNEINEEIERQKKLEAQRRQQVEAARIAAEQAAAALAAQQAAQQQAAALAAQQAEAAYLAVVIPIKCDAPSCQRHTNSFTRGRLIASGHYNRTANQLSSKPGWNCKWQDGSENSGWQHHCPRVRGE